MLIDVDNLVDLLNPFLGNVRVTNSNMKVSKIIEGMFIGSGIPYSSRFTVGGAHDDNDNLTDRLSLVSLFPSIVDIVPDRVA